VTFEWELMITHATKTIMVFVAWVIINIFVLRFVGLTHGGI